MQLTSAAELRAVFGHTSRSGSRSRSRSGRPIRPVNSDKWYAPRQTQAVESFFFFRTLQGESLMREETRALAVFLCHLCTNKITLIPVLMKGTDSLHGTKLTDTVFTVRRHSMNSRLMM